MADDAKVTFVAELKDECQARRKSKDAADEAVRRACPIQGTRPAHKAYIDEGLVENALQTRPPYTSARARGAPPNTIPARLAASSIESTTQSTASTDLDLDLGEWWVFCSDGCCTSCKRWCGSMQDA